MKIFSWNVNGIRAVLKKGLFQPFLDAHRPDIVCLQETKAERGQIRNRPARVSRILEFGRKKGLFRHRHLFEGGAAVGHQRVPSRVRQTLLVRR